MRVTGAEGSKCHDSKLCRSLGVILLLAKSDRSLRMQICLRNRCFNVARYDVKRYFLGDVLAGTLGKKEL